MNRFNAAAAALKVKTLTQRQLDVLTQLSEGWPHKSIAERLCISQKTVEQHVLSLYKKLGVHCIAHAVRAAVAAGVVQ